MRQLAFLQKKRDRHGDLFPVRLMGEQMLVAGTPDLVKQVFNAPPDVLHAGEGNRRVLGRVLGDSALLLLDEERHMGHRRLLLPALHGPRLERLAESMRRRIEARLDGWPTGESAVVLPRLRVLALESVMHAVFGEDDGELGPLRATFEALLSVSLEQRGDAPAFARAVDDAETAIVEQVLARRERGADGDEDLLSVLLEARDGDGAPLSDTEVRDEVMGLMVAGTETSASSMAWTLELLAHAPEALTRIAGEAGADGPYAEAVICEALRMRPPARMAARLVKRSFRLGGTTIPPGMVVGVSPLLIHHMPDVYPDPHEFRPERFLESKPGTYTWIPFGGGVRRCIGASFAMLEIRSVVAALLARMELRPASAAPERALYRGNTMAPAGGCHLLLERRRAGAR